MKTRLLVAVLWVCIFTVLLAGSSFAACANVVGTWTGKMNFVTCYNSTKACSYSTYSHTKYITSQSGCLFYGHTDDNYMFAGSIVGTDINFTIAPDTAYPYGDVTIVLGGKLAALNAATGKYTQMILSGTGFPAPSSLTPPKIALDITSFTGTFTRSQ